MVGLQRKVSESRKGIFVIKKEWCLYVSTIVIEGGQGTIMEVIGSSKKTPLSAIRPYRVRISPKGPWI